MTNLLTPAQAAEMLGGSVRLGRLVRVGKIAYVQMGTGKTLASFRFRTEDVEEAIAALAELKTPTVYVVGYARYVKIGFSTDFAERYLDLQEPLPVQLVVYASFPGSVADERRLHARFARHRSRGEWFFKRGELRRWIEAGCPADPPSPAPFGRVESGGAA